MHGLPSSKETLFKSQLSSSADQKHTIKSDAGPQYSRTLSFCLWLLYGVGRKVGLITKGPDLGGCLFDRQLNS